MYVYIYIYIDTVHKFTELSNCTNYVYVYVYIYIEYVNVYITHLRIYIYTHTLNFQRPNKYRSHTKNLNAKTKDLNKDQGDNRVLTENPMKSH